MVKTTFLDIIHIQSCIPKTWKMTLNKYLITYRLITQLDNTNRQQSKKIITTTYKNIYCHIINSEKHTPTNVKKWAEQYSNLYNVEPYMYGKECSQCPLKQLVTPTFKHFNIK